MLARKQSKTWVLYAMVAGVSHHDIAFNMCHVGCKGTLHDHVACCLAMYVFLTMWYAFFKIRENFNLDYLKVKND